MNYENPIRANKGHVKRTDEPSHGGTEMRYPIWSTECPSCKTGRVILFTKGGTAQCKSCDKQYDTDYEEHPELETPEVEYWLTYLKEGQK